MHVSKNKNFLLFLYVSISTLPILFSMSIAPALPILADHFSGLSDADFKMKLFLNLPGAATMISAPFVGYFIDKFGAKLSLSLSLILYMLGGGITGLLADSYVYFLIGRLAVGLSISFIFINANILIRKQCTVDELPKIMGLQTVAISSTAIFGLIVGNYLAGIHWRLPFLLLYISFIYLIIVQLSMDNYKKVQASEIKDNYFSFLNKETAFIYGLTVSQFFCFFFIASEIPFYLKTLIVKNQANGLVMSIFNFFILCGGVIYIYIQKKIKLNPVFLIAYCLVIIGFNGLTSTSLASIVAYLALSGFSLGIIITQTASWVQLVGTSMNRSKVMSGYFMCVYAGQFLSSFFSKIGGSLFQDKITIIIYFHLALLFVFIFKIKQSTQ